jgi:hypothetical protein
VRRVSCTSAVRAVTAGTMGAKIRETVSRGVRLEAENKCETKNRQRCETKAKLLTSSNLAPDSSSLEQDKVEK